MTNLKVRNIFEEADGYAVVSVNVELFKEIVGFDKKVNPLLRDYTTGKNAAGKGVRIFDIDGVPVYTVFNGKDAQYNTSIIMKSADAHKYLETLEQERAGETALAFHF